VFLAEKMDIISILVLKKDIDAAAEAIAQTGLLHPARIEDVEDRAGDLAPFESAGTVAAYSALRQRMARLLGNSFEECRRMALASAQDIRPGSLTELETALPLIEANVLPLLSAYEAAESSLNELRTGRSKHESLLALGYPLAQLGQSVYLNGVAGIIEEEQLEKLKSLLGPAPSLVFPYEKEKRALRVLCIVLRKDQALLEQALKSVSFQELAGMEEFAKVSDGLQENIRALEQECDTLAGQLNAAREKVMPELTGLLGKLDAAILVLHLRDMCKTTAHSCVLAGWVPRANTHELVNAVAAKTGTHVHVEVVPAEDLGQVAGGSVTVPVLFSHPKFLKPFEVFIETYGMPSYKMIDPTLFAFMAFLVMFGMMFGDLGHGIVLVLAGLMVMAKFTPLRNIGKLLMYCGASASVFGLLFGSVFGVETLIPALWVRPVERIEIVFAAAVGLGVMMLSGGVILNTIHAIRTRSLSIHFFENTGPLGGIIYWIGIVMVAKLVSSSMNPESLGVEFLLFCAFLLLFFLKGPARRIVRRESPLFPEGVLTYIIESAVEVLELLMGYLANTVSFIRVAAFGLAHTGLLIAVFGISDIVARWPAGTVFAALVLIVGNVFVIVFEGAIVTIQILRLEYYEFFGKFFKEFGVKYRPVRYADAFVDSAG